MDYTSTPPNSVTPSVGTHGSRRFLVLFVLLLAVGLVAGSFIFFRNKGKKSESVAALTDNVKKSNVPAAASAPVINQALINDKDQDGLSAEEEKKLGTSDLEFDTDHDGLSDYAEVKIWHTDPKNSDSDGDGYTDGWEVLHGYNPNGPGKLPR